MITTENNTYIVDGYEFESETEAREAQREESYIMTMKSKLNFRNSSDMLKVYQRLVDKQVFHTPVGIQFLSEFREYLIGDGEQPEDAVPAVKVKRRQGMTRSQREQFEFLQADNQNYARQKKYYLITIFVLAAVIILMFVITALNPNVGYINTENKILNKYAQWEEELTEREKLLDEREAQMTTGN
jgi:hypothetical protein